MKVPEPAAPHQREIEELFDPALLATKIDGKSFDPKKEHGDDAHYGKVIFAKEVVRAKAGSIDFSSFEELLSRLEQALVHYKGVSAAATKPAPTTKGIAASGS